MNENDLINKIANGVNKRIFSQDVALQFVLEELDAARQGNAAAIQFVKNSGFSPPEYEGAMHNSFDEVDGVNGPQQFLLTSIMEYRSDMDFMLNLRLKIVQKIIDHWQLRHGGNAASPESQLCLVDVIRKVENSGYGAFVDVNNDLGAFIEENEDCDPLIKMSYSYARRTAVAGMYLQGIVKKELYDHVYTVFKGLQLTTGHTVEFQENAAEQAFRLISSYTDLFDEVALSFIVTAVHVGEAHSPTNGEILDIETLASTFNDSMQKLIKLYEKYGSNISNDSDIDKLYWLEGWLADDSNEIENDDYELLAEAPFIIFIVMVLAEEEIDIKETAALAEAIFKPGQLKSEFLVQVIRDAIPQITHYSMSECLTSIMNSDLSFLQKLQDLNFAIDNNLDANEAIQFKTGLLTLGYKIADTAGGLFGLNSKVWKQEEQMLQTLIQLLEVKSGQ